METEVRTLKQELARTQDSLKVATKRCRDLVRELDHRVAGHESERTLRDQQLTRILRALLVLESRLKQEQKSIRQLLCEKDNVIRNQQLEIAMLRRYTKNYIKCKRDRTLTDAEVNTNNNVDKSLQSFDNFQKEALQTCSLGKDIASLKCEIITRLNPPSSGIVLEELDRSGVKKTNSFAGSDISKASLTSSENTDASIITTTTEGSPSLLSTEGFCEGESTDVSPGSTLNKCRSNRCTPTTVTDSENEMTMIVDDENDEDVEKGATRGRTSLRRARGQKTSKGVEMVVSIPRTDSKDDGMDCNFVSEDEEQDTRTRSREGEREGEPIYANACNGDTDGKSPQQTESPRTEDDRSNNNNNNNNVERKIVTPELTAEDTSGNWYSDPDEDRLNDDIFRHSTYRSNSNHNSVLECVNQILLRDMEEEESVLSMPRRFKHRGRIVRFQPARLSDIESVGSEMERRNSEESNGDNKDSSREDEAHEDNERSASEDEFGMRIVQKDPIDDHKDSKAIPLVIIEPKVETVEETNKFLAKPQASNPPLKMERMEEKTCLQMSARGLTIAKPQSTNLDYEDIESLPEVTRGTSPTPPRTPPALPPKPQFRNNTLTLKKIPSPSFLIDEKKSQQDSGCADPARRGILDLLSTSTSKVVRSLNLEEAKSSARSSTREAGGGNREEPGFWRSRFNHVRSSFQARQKESDQTKSAPKVTNIVRHFEEFKIGDPEEQTGTKDRTRARERHAETKPDFDIRQNFEEFNLDECDLSDDPDRPEGDGSERLSHSALNNPGRESESNIAKDNNNILVENDNGNGNEESGSSGYDHFLEATGLSNKSILTPSRLLSNHKSMLKPKDVKYKSRIKATAILERHGVQTIGNSTTHVRHWTGPFV